MRTIQKNEKAPEGGLVIQCPHCTHRSRVFHLEWETLKCECGQFINKNQYLVPEDQVIMEIENIDLTREHTPHLTEGELYQLGDLLNRAIEHQQIMIKIPEVNERFIDAGIFERITVFDAKNQGWIMIVYWKKGLEKWLKSFSINKKKKR